MERAMARFLDIEEVQQQLNEIPPSPKHLIVFVFLLARVTLMTIILR